MTKLKQLRGTYHELRHKLELLRDQSAEPDRAGITELIDQLKILQRDLKEGIELIAHNKVMRDGAKQLIAANKVLAKDMKEDIEDTEQDLLAKSVRIIEHVRGMELALAGGTGQQE